MEPTLSHLRLQLHHGAACRCPFLTWSDMLPSLAALRYFFNVESSGFLGFYFVALCIFLKYDKHRKTMSSKGVKLMSFQNGVIPCHTEVPVYRLPGLFFVHLCCDVQILANGNDFSKPLIAFLAFLFFQRSLSFTTISHSLSISEKITRISAASDFCRKEVTWFWVQLTGCANVVRQWSLWHNTVVFFVKMLIRMQSR